MENLSIGRAMARQINLDSLDRLTREFVERFPERCAVVTATGGQKLYYALIALALLVLLKYRWDYFVLVVSLFLAFWYLAALIFRGGAALAALCRPLEERVTPEELARLSDRELPVYTILLPLYHEEKVAEKLIRNLGRLDYPPDKLEILLLLECDDQETRHALEAAALPPSCRVLVVPDGPVRTKPRACNYGLEAARGEFCVIYDAEDAPEPDQLKKAVAVFRRDRTGHLACVQAKLNYYNPTQNWLTRFFTVEYTTHFDLLLSGMRWFRLPLPLGGTSNHFRTAKLREAGSWDPFNVTEDCDLGIRIYEAGYATTVVDSTTFEEANSQLGNWLRQRSRWVKGFLQTHLVHFRSWRSPVRRLGWWGAFGVFLEVGGGSLMMLTNLLFWLLMGFYALLLAHGVCHGVPILEQVVGPQLGGTLYHGISLGWFELRAWPLVYWGPGEDFWRSHWSMVFFTVGMVLLLANLVFIAIGVAGCCRRRCFRLLPWAVLMPFYWLLISLGAWKGLWQLFTKPFYWEKTRHGLDLTPP